MKKLFAFLALLILSFTLLAAQETEWYPEDSPDWDIDSLFDEPLPEMDAEENAGDAVSSVLGAVKKRGLTLEAAFEFQGGFAPGWDMSPWYFNGDEKLTWGLGVKMNSHIKLDARISEVFRIITVLNFNIPGPIISLGDFFFDYDLFDAVFVRAGKYEHSWGISPNYGFTNLLSRVPKDSFGGESYIFKADVPIGVGGIQALSMTRVNLIYGIAPTYSDIGYGGKYNLALRWADFDIGAFYQDSMTFRSFLSIKTTIVNTELYHEWLVTGKSDFAVNFGFVSDLFAGKMTVNGEFFYNGEEGVSFYRPETNIQKADTPLFVEGVNLALNLLYRFGGKANTRFFVQTRYAPSQNSAQLVPGFRLSPLSNIDIYLAVPMALGAKSGYYYTHTADPNDRPFSVMLLVTLNGAVQAELGNF